MTLLQYEQGRVNALFDRHWAEWLKNNEAGGLQVQHEIGMFWDHFPFNLYDYFPEVTMNAARHVALAARAASMYTALLYKRNIGQLSHNEFLAAGSWLQAFSRAQLAEVIAEQLPFWQHFMAGYDQCGATSATESVFCFSPIESSEPQVCFAELIESRAILPRVTLRAFVTLSGQIKLLEPLSESQHHLYAGLQLFHDILNWKEDYLSGRLTYPLAIIVRAMSMNRAEKPAGRQLQLAEVEGFFYCTGLVEQFLAKASDCYCRAMAAVTDLPPTLWRATLTQLLERSEHLRKDLEQKRQRKMEHRSGSRLQPKGIAGQPSMAPFRSQIGQAMQVAARYLAQEQATDGHWGDFLLSGEQSTFWVTGYVGWTLNLTQMTGADLDRAAQWLLDNQSPNGGWGYNCNWPVDTDTIANIIMFLSSRSYIEPVQWAPALELLLAHQKPDGGFSTVIDATAWLSRFPPEVDDLNGWTASHPCVTAVTAMLLATLDQGRYHPQAARALAYLCAQQHAAGYWNAYWWTGQFYTTSRAVQAMSTMDDGRFSAHLAKASTWILASQLTDGGWTASNNWTAQSFQTALAVQALCFSKAGARQIAAIRRGIHCLLSQQAMDGSWPAIPIMLLPSPDIVHPWNQNEWNESILGLNVIVPDWHRLFTTATVLQALHVAMNNPALGLID